MMIIKLMYFIAAVLLMWALCIACARMSQIKYSRKLMLSFLALSLIVVGAIFSI